MNKNTDKMSVPTKTIIAVNEFFDQETNQYFVTDRDGTNHQVAVYGLNNNDEEEEDDDEDFDYLACSFTTKEEYLELLQNNHLKTNVSEETSTTTSTSNSIESVESVEEQNINVLSEMKKKKIPTRKSKK